MRWLVRRRTQNSFDDGGSAVGAIDRKMEALRAATSERQCLTELFCQMIEAGDNAVMGDQRLDRKSVV